MVLAALPRPGAGHPVRGSVVTILAIADRPTNGHLIADAAALGYIGDHVLDPTWGHGTFWTIHRPRRLVAHDLDPDKAPGGHVADMRRLPYRDGAFDTVVLDGPFKLNGTSSAPDERYGVHVPASRDARHQLIIDGIVEACRVVRVGGHVLVKCQDQVNGGKVRWQTDIFTRAAEALGMRKVDALLFPSYRPQPEGRSQQHARRNYSTLLVFVKEARR